MKIDNNILKLLQTQIGKSNQKAFEDFYRLFFARLFNFAMLYVHKKEIAEELVNDVMVKVWTKREFIEQIENLETYLFVAIRNSSLNHLDRYSSMHVVVDDTENTRPQIINLNDPERELEWKEIYGQLNMAINELPDQCRTVFKLIKEEGFKYKQVAEILGISPRTVETQLFRAIKKLDKVVELYLEKPRSKNRKNKLPPISVLLFFLTSL